MAIEVGDAVLKALIDTSHLDGEFARVGAEAEQGLQPATDALDGVQEGFKDAATEGNKAADEITDAGRRSSASLREARGEAALLGEEFGIRLPRHVRNFVAELPGVGTALQAAFSATAVLFIVQALFQAEQKLEAWLNKVPEAVKKTIEWQKGMAELYVSTKKVNDELAHFDETPLQKMQREAKAAHDEYDALLLRITTAYAQMTIQAQQNWDAVLKAKKADLDLTDAQLKKEEEKSKAADNSKLLSSIKTEIELRKQLANAQVDWQQAINGLSKENADEERYQISLKALRALAVAEEKYGKDSVDEVRKTNAQIETLQAQHALKLSEELKQQTAELTKNLAEMQKAVVEHGGVDIILPKNMQQLLQFRAEAKALGVTLDVDLAQKVALAKKALADYVAMGGKDVHVINQLKEALAKFSTESLAARLKENKATLESAETELVEAKARHQNVTAIEQQINALKRVQAELKKEQVAADKTKDSITRLSDSAKQSAQELGDAVASAMQGMLTHQETFGKAMEKAVLGVIAKQAQAWGQYYIGIGTAELLTGDPSGGLVLAEGVALEALAGVLGAIGSGVNSGNGASGTAGTAYGSGKNNYQYGSSVSDTTSQAGSGRSTVGVQGFADGGLVSAPTLAMIGEGGGREAVIPLDDPEAMRAIRGGDGSGGGGDTHFHVNVHGLISDGDLGKVMKKMSNMVSRGRGSLNSSSTFKVTRRGA